MTVAELIAALTALPADAPVLLHWDGASRTKAEAVWLTKAGYVSISNLDQPVYDDEDRTADAATEEQDRYLTVWEMLGEPEPSYDDDYD